MPLCVFQTNVPSKDIPEGFEKELSQLLADILSKPIERISVTLQPEQRMCRGGTNEPTCLVIIWSIAVFSAENNPAYADKLYPFIAEKLGIPNDRIVLLFHDIKAEQVAKPN